MPAERPTDICAPPNPFGRCAQSTPGQCSRCSSLRCRHPARTRILREGSVPYCKDLSFRKTDWLRSSRTTSGNTVRGGSGAPSEPFRPRREFYPGQCSKCSKRWSRGSASQADRCRKFRVQFHRLASETRAFNRSGFRRVALLQSPQDSVPGVPAPASTPARQRPMRQRSGPLPASAAASDRAFSGPPAPVPAGRTRRARSC